MNRAAALLLLTALTPTVAASAQAVGSAWAGDVRVLAAGLPSMHPGAFARLDRVRWDSAVAATERRIPSLPRNAATVALMELVALVRDGHSVINPFFNPAIDAHYFPLELHAFDDGLFVRAAAPEYRDLVGWRVTRLGRVGVDSAWKAFARIVPHENDWWLRAIAPSWMSIAETLDGLGLLADPLVLPLEVERNGVTRTMAVRMAGKVPRRNHGPGSPVDQSTWVTMRADGPAPFWLRRPGVPYWATFDSASATLYVAYRAVMTLDNPTNNEFWAQVFAMADSLPLRRMVIDIRENAGGNSFYNRQVVRGIVARPALDRGDRLFVITGKQTFSAAMNLARDLEQWTSATFVGEPTGNARRFYGDHEELALPASGLVATVSTLFWPSYDPRDNRDFLAPAIFTPLTSDAYRQNVDPAMTAILGHAITAPLADRLHASAATGDLAGARRILAAAAADPRNRFRSPEADANAAGYRLLRERATDRAVALFRLNTEVYAESANAWDSLGEALASAGHRDDAVTAYRRALAISPRFVPSLQGLERLGVATDHARVR